MNASIESLRDTITPKSDQLNADDLIAGPIVVKIKAVKRGDTADQPISLVIDGDRQPYKPCKSMRRVMISAWGDDGREWVGKYLKLYCDPNVKFGGVKVGGIRISHMTGIESRLSVMLTTTRSKRSEYIVEPLQMPPPTQEQKSANVAKAKAAIAPKPPIEGTATTVPDSPFPPEAGDLSGVCGTKPERPDHATLKNIVAAFARIGYDIEAMEKEYGKRLDDWTMDDVPEAREVYKVLLAQHKAAQEQGDGAAL